MFEFRFYAVAAGRQAAEVARMYDVAIAGAPPRGSGPSLFDSFGIPRPLGAWTGLAGTDEPVFCYLLEWPTLKARDAAFPPFWADPVWREIRDRTDDGVPMVERVEDWLLRPSPTWDDNRPKPRHQPGTIYELLILDVRSGSQPQAAGATAEVLLPGLERKGAGILGLFDVVIGPDMPRSLAFLSWPDFETMRSAWTALHLDRDFNAPRSGLHQQDRPPPILDIRHHLLEAVSFGIPQTSFGAAT